MMDRQTGQLMVLVALAMVGLMGFAALAVDLGYAYSQRRLAQNGADAATMAAVRMVRTSPPSTAGSVIYSEIVRVAGLNGNSQVDSANTVFLDVNGNSLGTVASYTGSLENVAGVRVETQIQYNTFFAGIIGINTMTSAGEAAAMSMAVGSVSGTGLRPIAVPNQDFTTGMTYTIWDSSWEASGNAGWLDFNGGSSGASELGPWISSGFVSSASNMFTYYEGGSSPGSEQQGTALPFPSWVQGDPGIKNGVEGDVQSLVGTSISILVYDNLEGTGSNTRYRVTGMVQFRIASVDMSGNPKLVRGEFERSVVAGDPLSSTYTTGLMSTVRLVPNNMATSLPTSTAAPSATPESTSVVWPTETTGPGPTATATTAPTLTPTATATPTAPAAPSGLVVTAIVQDPNPPHKYEISLSWQDNSSNEQGFQVERSVDAPGSWFTAATKGSNVTTHTDTGLQGGKTYYYRVKAYNATGASAYSNEVSAVAP